MDVDEKPSLRWGVERKLEFIEFRLFWEGYVNRSDLIETFNESANQASSDLNRYLTLAPDNMAYDKSARTYVRASAFKHLFLKPDASLYLSQVRSLGDGLLDQRASWIGNVPEYASIPFTARGVLPPVLRAIVVESGGGRLLKFAISRCLPRTRNGVGLRLMLSALTGSDGTRELIVKRMVCSKTLSSHGSLKPGIAGRAPLRFQMMSRGMIWSIWKLVRTLR